MIQRIHCRWTRYACFFVGAIICFVPGIDINAARADAYYGGQLGRVTHAWSEQVDHNNFSGVGLRFGGYWDHHLAFEGRLFFGVNDQKQPDSFGIRKVKLNHAIGVYSRWDLPFSRRFIPYGIVGITRAELADNTEIILQRERSVTGVSYGFGVDLFYSNFGALNLEWVQWVNKESDALTALQLGLIGKF